jgi:tetratricopeptide (TPR) repeat protein
LGYALLLGGQVLVLFFSGARASWLGALAALPVFGFAVAWRLEQRRLWRAILVVTVAGGALLLLLNIPNGPLQPLRQVHGLSRIANITDSGGTEGSAQGRILIWQGVKNLLITDPSIGGSWGGPARIVVGYGPESMLWAFQHDFPLALRRANSEINAWDRAHNIYLDYLVDAGAVALLVLLAVLAAFFWRIGRMLPRVDEPAAWILIAVAAAMVGHLVDGFFSLETAVSFLLFWTMVGVVASDGLTREDEAPEPAQASSLELLGWLAVGFVGAALLLTIASATDHPTLLAVFWLLSVMAGAGVVAAGLLGEVKVRFPSALPRRRSLTVCLLALAAGALALGSQMHVETAAFADRIGTNVLNGGQPFAGLEYLEQAAATDPYEPSYQTHLAQAYLSLGQNRTDPAATEATYVPKPGDERTLDPARAVNMGQNQLFQLAAFALESARSLSPLDPDAYENLGVVYRVWGRPQEALAEYRRAQQLTFNSPRYLDDEALAELDAQRPQVAARDARAALNLDTTFWLSHYALAKVDHQLGDHAAAKGEAGLALYWFHNYWPPPPASQIDELKSLQKNG